MSFACGATRKLSYSGKRNETPKMENDTTIGPKRPPNDVQFRLKSLEQAAEALRLAANDVIRHDERLKTLFGKCEEHDAEIAALRREQTAATEDINNKIDDLSIRFDENKSYFSRWFLTLFTTIITALVVAFATFILNR